jgi:L-threonylcarbamoyladenylate synthase
VPYEFLIDGGRLAGTPSTVVDLAERKVLRAGADIDRVAKFLLTM